MAGRASRGITGDSKGMYVARECQRHEQVPAGAERTGGPAPNRQAMGKNERLP